MLSTAVAAGVLIKYLGEVLAASDSHKVITSFTGSDFLRNLHLRSRKGLFILTGVRAHARTRTVFVFPPCFNAVIPLCFSFWAIHTWFVTQEIFNWAESNSH